MSTLAEYNNNPGNIRPAKGVNYEGMIGVDDKGFAIFENPQFGKQALINDITHKIEKRGINTPSDFVDVYAPAGKENSEEARDNYKIHIADQLGLKSTNAPFPENSIDKLAGAISHFESGKQVEGENKPAPATSAAPVATPAKPVTDEVSLPMQQAILGTAGALAGSSLGVAKYPIVGAYNWMTGADKASPNINKVEPILESPKTSEWPGTRTPDEEKLTRSTKQNLGTGDKSEMTGRESQTGYTEKTAQTAARKKNQTLIAEANNLNPNQVFAEHPDVASTQSGVLASKKAIDEINNEKQAIENANRDRNLAAAKTAGEEWKRVQAAQLLAKTGTPEQKTMAMKFLDSTFGKFKNLKNSVENVGNTIRGSFPGRLGLIAGGLGASAPLAWNEYKAGNPNAAAAIAGTGATLGALAHKFPKTTGALGTGASVGYALTHPEESGMSMTMSDVVDPVMSMFLTGQEMFEPALPGMQPKEARGGRGFVNPPVQSTGALP